MKNVETGYYIVHTSMAFSAKGIWNSKKSDRHENDVLNIYPI